MKSYIGWITVILAFVLMPSACEVGETPQITPAADRLTFLYFYVDN